RGGELYSCVGRIDYLSRTIAWGPETLLGAGTFADAAMDDRGKCLIVRTSDQSVVYQIGKIEPGPLSIVWDPPEIVPGAVDPCAMALLREDIAIAVHSDNGRLRSSVGWLRGDGTIEWGDFLEFGEGLLPKIAANDEGICMVCY